MVYNSYANKVMRVFLIKHEKLIQNFNYTLM